MSRKSLHHHPKRFSLTRILYVSLRSFLWLMLPEMLRAPVKAGQTFLRKIPQLSQSSLRMATILPRLLGGQYGCEVHDRVTTIPCPSAARLRLLRRHSQLHH
ncbi:hypothetical protein BDW69DRAFT_163864 [Aspergillus filifer]